MSYLPPVELDGVAIPANPGDIQDGDATVEFKPPFIPAAKCAKVEIRFVADEQQAENVLYFYKSGGNYTYTQLYDLAVAVNTAWQDNIIPIWNTSTELVMIRASDMSSQFGPVYELTIDPPVPGTRTATAPETVDNCIGIGTHTGFKGRSQNGRVFLAGTCVGDFSLSVPLDAPRILYLNSMVSFMNTMTAAGHSFVLVSFQSKKQWRVNAQVTTIAFLSVGPWIYTMRRRLPGHNRHR